MSTQLRPYPEYKESGVAWLGLLPRSWAVLPLRAAADLWGRRGITKGDTQDAVSAVLAVTPSELNGRHAARSTASYIHSSRAGAFDIAPAGATALCTIASVGQTARFVAPFAMNPQVRGLAPKGSVNSEYLFWSLRVLGVELQRIASVSVVPFVNTSTLMSQRIAVPPLAEQTAIARVLRWHDVVVRRLIRAKRRMIELLDEQKQAIIQHAVTRGLDPNVPLMPSGVLWIGDIPAHWRVAEVKRLGKLRAGSGFPHAFQGRTTGELPFFKVADMTTVGNSTRLCVASNAISLEDARTLGATIFPAQAIVFPKVGGALLTNKRRILAGPSCIDNNIMGFIPSGGDPEYWFLTLQLVDFGKLANPGPVPSLNESQVAEVRLPVPPDAEQSTIVDGVRAESRVVDEALIVAQREIDLIREYRTRLVCDVVTGKLDVRHVEVPYVPEDDVLDVPEADDELLPDDADLGEEADA